MITKINKKNLIVLKKNAENGESELLPMSTLQLSYELERPHTMIKKELRELYENIKDKRKYYSPCYELPVKTYTLTIKGLNGLLDYYLSKSGYDTIGKYREEESDKTKLVLYYEDVKAERSLYSLLRRMSKMRRPGDKKKALDTFVTEYLENNSLDFDKIIVHLANKGKDIVK
jgi:hypothetical protein